jgi:hypothetical protein
MDEKTEELRDIFIDATGADTVTERQEESRGSLTADERADERVPELVRTMREEYAFTTDLDDEALERVVRGFHDDEDDQAVADGLDADPETVFAARMDLHLVSDADREAPFDLSELRVMVVGGAPLDERVATLDADEPTVRRLSRVVEADLRSTRANDRFRDEFAELLTDSELSESYAESTHEDGLREAAEDIETDVSL